MQGSLRDSELCARVRRGDLKIVLEVWILRCVCPLALAFNEEEAGKQLRVTRLQLLDLNAEATVVPSQELFSLLGRLQLLLQIGKELPDPGAQGADVRAAPDSACGAAAAARAQ